MHVRFLLGPAGSGKTFHCLSEIRTALAAAPEGPPLILLAPKQATFQLERQLLSDDALAGYTRLHIFSFERLADFVFAQLQRPQPELLTEQGRVMVLRALLTERHHELKLFRASARLPGFAHELSALLRELQRHRFSPGLLAQLTGKVGQDTLLGRKLHDFALLFRHYLDWLKGHELADADSLLDLAADALARVDRGREPFGAQHGFVHLAGLWLDGFAQMTPQERRLLAALIPYSERATLAFCLESEPTEKAPWHSPWSLISQTFRQCHADLIALPGSDVEVKILRRDVAKSRFAAVALQHLEKHWSLPQPFDPDEPSVPNRRSLLNDPLPAEPLPATERERAAAGQFSNVDLQSSIRIVACANPEAEATLAAREILRFVRAGGRFRESAVLLRQLALYHDSIRRVFSRYDIPFFLDRREPVAHHPLAELTRSALRTVAFGWQDDDWFGALKTGLVHAAAAAIDHLENEALARGWQGKVWQTGWKLEGDDASAVKMDALRAAIVPPFLALQRALASPPSGQALALAIRQFWEGLGVHAILEEWSRKEVSIFTAQPSDSIHATVWKQMHDWLDNLALAFPHETQPLSRWLPVIEAGLSSLTVGVIPPALDQVLVGAIDRSRNPDLRQTLVLGVNEMIFPAPPPTSTLLNALDCDQLEKLGHPVGADTRLQLGHERFYGYIACTRARERLVLTFSQRGLDGKALNPSVFVSHLQRLFPKLAVEEFSGQQDWARVEHANELIAPVLNGLIDGPSTEAMATLGQIPGLAHALERLRQLRPLDTQERLSPGLADQLYSSTLATSVSRLEQFAACPFRFFVHSGLQAEERKRFELDVRERGTFQHEVLALFHEQLRDEGKQWRDVTPAEASERVGRICDDLIPHFQQGVMQVAPENLFAAQTYKVALQQFVATAVGWMKQYEFDPRVVEIGFGREGRLPAWELELGESHRLALHGRIDRVDMWQAPGTHDALCIVIDYKSGFRKPDALLLEYGIQQQLPVYLNVLRRLAPRDAQSIFGVSELRPVGVFYVNLRGSYAGGPNRVKVLSAASEARRLAYQHQGIFDLNALPRLDTREGIGQGDQFNYRLRRDGEPFKNEGGVMRSSEFIALLDRNEAMLRELGQRIFAGQAQVDPFRKGQESACVNCDYYAICRIDPWTHSFRVLSARSGQGSEPAD